MSACNPTTVRHVQGNVCVVNGSPHLCSVLLYERSRKQWVRHAPMNAPRLHAAMASVGGRVYIMVSLFLQLSGFICRMQDDITMYEQDWCHAGNPVLQRIP